MKRKLIDEIALAIRPYVNCVNNAVFDDIKLQLDIVLKDYDVREAETSLVVWEGDLNEKTVRRFLAAKMAAGCSMRTVDFYNQCLRGFFCAEQKNYDDVDADDIRYYLAKRTQIDGVSKVTANNERRVLSSFFGWLQKEEILLRNPMSKVDAIKVTKEKKKAFQLMDIEKIRGACCTNRERAMVEFLASTWCRVSEVVEVKVADIENGKCTVHGKGDKYREVYLNARCVYALTAYLNERHDDNPYLFPRAKYAGDIKRASKRKDWYKDCGKVAEQGHMDASSFENVIRNIGKRAGVSNTHPHRFRRTGATMALKQGMPLTAVSKLLGHESIETTQIYLDISYSELEANHRKYVV